MYFTVYRLGVKPYTDLYINVIIYKYILIIKHKISPLLCFSGFCRPSTKIDKCSPPYTQQGNKSLLLYNNFQFINSCIYLLGKLLIHIKENLDFLIKLVDANQYRKHFLRDRT